MGACIAPTPAYALTAPRTSDTISLQPRQAQVRVNDNTVSTSHLAPILAYGI